MAKVSIIVPVYNVEKYVARCLDSCINQTFEDLEIICVNDGSTDRSLEILEAYARLDSRVKFVTKGNGGLSSARNTGVEIAQGEYILYVDSDDYISSTTVERVYNNAKQNDSDVVIFDYYCLRTDPRECESLTIEPLGNKYVNSTFNADSVGAEVYKYIPVCAWVKLYRADLLKNNGIIFDEGLLYEDISYWAKVFVKAKRISYFNEPLYAYMVGRNNQIMARNDEKLFDIIKIYEIVEKVFKDSEYFDKYKSSIDILMMMDYLKKLSVIKQELREDLFNVLKSLNKTIDYDYYEQDGVFIFEKLSARNFKLLNTVDNLSEFMKLQKGVFND